MQPILGLIDRLSILLAFVAMGLAIVLIGTMGWEVIARYGLNRPTVWSIDISFMCNGAMFLLAAGYTLRMDRHVRIDVLSARMPAGVRNTINAIFLIGVFIPCIAWLGWTASGKAITAYRTMERELSSAWGPYIWPFYGAVALGLVALCLQAIAEAVRHLSGIRQTAPAATP